MYMNKLFRLFVILFVCSSCENVLQDTAKTDTDQAIFYEAKLSLNDRDYTSALALLDTLSPAFLAQREVSLIRASAYSGRCGMEFVSLVNSLSDLGSNNLFLFLMQTYTGATAAQVADCIESETILNGFGDYTQRVADENILMGFSSLTKVGSIIAQRADLDLDDVTDPSFDHCDNTLFPEADVRQVGSGIANAILSITAVASDISSGTLAQIAAFCAQSSSLNVICTNTDPTAYTALEVRALRQLIGSTDLGIGACPNFADLACVCP
jgi:hypothetical protein